MTDPTAERGMKDSSNTSPDLVIAQLTDSSSRKRRGAAKKLGQVGVDHPQAGAALYSAFRRELLDSRTWETQTAMADSLGLLGHHPALPELSRIIYANKTHDALTIAAATAYCRIARTSINDAKPILELLEFAKFSVASGALRALGCDRMVPPEVDVKRILDHTRRFNYETGYGDPRYGAAVAAAGWGDAPEILAFLESCLESKDSGVVEAAKSSLRRKYVKCR
jgi:HEAT repeat protein